MRPQRKGTGREMYLTSQENELSCLQAIMRQKCVSNSKHLAPHFIMKRQASSCLGHLIWQNSTVELWCQAAGNSSSSFFYGSPESGTPLSLMNRAWRSHVNQQQRQQEGTWRQQHEIALLPVTETIIKSATCYQAEVIHESRSRGHPWQVTSHI